MHMRNTSVVLLSLLLLVGSRWAGVMEENRKKNLKKISVNFLCQASS